MAEVLQFPPIFIVGAGRSGTTLVRSLLSAHSRIAVTPETHFMKVARKHGGLKQGRPADFEAFWTDFVRSRRFRDLGVSPDRCRELIEAQGAPTMQAIFRALLAAYGERCGKPRLGEKTPGHCHFMPELLDCFPEARIIVLQRDPRAVVASQLKTPWTRAAMSPPSVRDGLLVNSRMHAIAFYAANWCRIYEDLVPAVAHDSRVSVVGYERLASDPEAVLDELCTFLGEPFEAGMLSGRSSATVPQPAAASRLNEDWRDWSKAHNAQTLGPVSTKSLHAWRDELTELELAIVEGRCARGMRNAGYEPLASPLRRSGGRLGARMIGAMERIEAKTRNRVGGRTGR